MVLLYDIMFHTFSDSSWLLFWKLFPFLPFRSPLKVHQLYTTLKYLWAQFKVKEKNVWQRNSVLKSIWYKSLSSGKEKRPYYFSSVKRIVKSFWKMSGTDKHCRTNLRERTHSSWGFLKLNTQQRLSGNTWEECVEDLKGSALFNKTEGRRQGAEGRCILSHMLSNWFGVFWVFVLFCSVLFELTVCF